MKKKRIKSVKQANVLPVEMVGVEKLKMHERNYRQHPPDQLEHLKTSIREHGFYKNVVVADDYTLLAGHGAVKAAKELGYEEIPVVRLQLSPDDPLAIKVMTADNEIEHLADQDDRLLSELLKEVRDAVPGGLMGTGYDDAMLANLVFVTRPESEIRGKHDAADWVGMPEYDSTDEPPKVVVRFKSIEDKMRFGKLIDVKFTEKSDIVWWPDKERLDAKSVKFE